MKKLLLLLVAMPFIALSQTALVQWDGSSFSPTYNATNISGGDITKSGINSSSWEYWGWNYGWFRFENLPSSSILNADKYIQFTATNNSTTTYNLNSFEFYYNAWWDGKGCNKYQVRYSKDGFSTYEILIAETNTPNSAQTNHSDNLLATGTFSNVSLAPSETVTIRIFAYDCSNGGWSPWRIKGAEGSVPGPVLKASVPVTALTANADAATTNPNTPVTINVLSNDVKANTVTTLTTTTPSHGSVTVNTDKTITYNPFNGYVGSDSFNYTINNTTDPASTATVNITVQATAPSGALNGTYYVGTSGNFTTLTSAVNYLNANGVSGPVTFLLTNATYSTTTGETFPLVINSNNTLTAINNVTFKPAPGNNAIISGSNSSPLATVIKLNGADYITFDGSNTTGGTTRNLTFYNEDVTNYADRSIIWVASNGTDGATHITVKNSTLKMISKNESYAYCVGIFSANNTVSNNAWSNDAATANNSNLTVTNNKFTNVKQGVYVNGGNTVTTNVEITKNDLGAENNLETIVQPTRLNNVSVFTYSENLIYNLYRDNTGGNLVASGVYVSGNSTNGTITKNNIKDLTKTADNGSYFAGIVLESSATDTQILVANNFINRVVGTTSGGAIYGGHGMIVVSGGGYKIFNNTIYLKDNPEGQFNPGSGYSSALYINNAVSNLDVKNNILINNETNTNVRRTAITIHKNVNTLGTVFPNGLDYNIYYSAGRFGYITNQWGEGDVSSPGNENPDYVQDFEIWKGITATDAHSLDVLPEFISASDLHVNPYANTIAQYNNKGTNAYITTVPKDIDGQLRSTTTPDIGADEFGSVTMPEPGSNDGVYCDVSTTWNGTSWSNGNPLEMSEADALSTDVIFTGNYTQNGGTFNACSIFVEGNANVDFTNAANATVKHNVNVADGASLTFESDTTLLQLENDQNTGIVTVKRYGSKLKRLDYTIWSAPVHDYRGSSSVAGQDFQSLHDFSPLTQTSPVARFYVYNTFEEIYDSVDPFTTKFEKGKGYLIRMPNKLYATGGGIPITNDYLQYNAGNIRFSFLASFEGTPNNGDVRIPVDYQDQTYRYNMIGNPYPSPLSVKEFINENIDVIEGTIWLWRKTNNGDETSYSTVTKMAYVANMALGGGNPLGDGNDGNDLIADPFILDLDGDGVLDPIINTAQGFIVAAKTTDDVVFKNSMRVKHNYNNFFKTGNFEQTPAAVEQTISRYWLNVKSSNNKFGQMAVGYSAETSKGYDNGYDGKMIASGSINLYSTLNINDEVTKLTIEARGAFEVTDRVSLGFKTTVAGQYELSLDHFDGVFSAGQDIYVVDNLTGTTHNLKTGAYVFTTDEGTFDNRFEIVYTGESALGTDVPVINNSEVIAYRNGNQINITAPKNISSVTVYDMLGRQLYSSNNNIAATEFNTSDITTAQQVVIVRITLENQQVVSKKIIMN
ncbi:T9SS sorting signal type C domain-containing protein [Flavobacterium rhizosphaerae]|uniref:T9SS sorting signal type C domain-containing protein n=1 Tax=Flavobacterium rhizosphaerae TaxID=3163298 RepID=A0ABW8YVI3_9FLAO